MQKFTRKEIFLKANTLNCVPIILQGHGVLIDLRNECSVAGRIDNADGHMNINLIEAVFIDRLQRQHAFEQFMVRERMIRQIHIPPHINITQEIRDWCESGCGRPKIKINKKRTFKEKRAQANAGSVLGDSLLKYSRTPIMVFSKYSSQFNSAISKKKRSWSCAEIFLAKAINRAFEQKKKEENWSSEGVCNLKSVCSSIVSQNIRAMT
ncbi:hypothetical protein GQX74_012346 [Glossina fuscipes]|nr:hypothetical protein GQX74_012346 [Glossina fuscipes]